MSERMFHGLCLGGPMDGRQADSQAPSFKAVKLLVLGPTTIISHEEQKLCDLAHKTISYKHEIMFVPPDKTGGMGEVEIGFWRLENETLLDAMRRLVKGYRPKGGG